MLGVVLDCADPDKLSSFWCAALRYRSLGVHGPYAVLVPEEGGHGPQVFLQRVDEPKAGKNRMHLDVHVADIAAEAGRLEALGARRIVDDVLEQGGNHWIVMADPEGNEFCICDGPDLSA